MIRSLISLLLFAAVITCTAQPKYDMTATDLPAIGVNKVLCMKNGNTMLFHFEPTKDIVVKVYDSMHKQIASHNHATRVLDEYIIKDAEFHGLFELNNEAVLFLDQVHLGRHGLVRLRFNGNTGALVEEKLVGESPTAIKRTRFHVMKEPSMDEYAILFSTDVPQFLDCRIYVTYYNARHEVLREIPIEIDRKKYDYLRVVNASAQPNGICLSFSLAKLATNSTQSFSGGDVFGTPNVYDHQYYVYYIPTNATKAMSTSINASTDVYPYFANYTYNPFARALNLLLLSYREVGYKYGVQWLPAALTKHAFLKIDEESMAISYTWMNNDSVSKQLQQGSDTSKFYEGIPLFVNTNKNGLTTVVSTAYSRYLEPENARRTNLYTYFGNIAITELDDDGKEIRGTVLPFAQRYTSHSHYYHPYQLINRRELNHLFSDMPNQVYEKQFVAFNCYQQQRNTFVVFNGNNTEFTTAGTSDKKNVLYNFNIANGYYYKINAKREVTRLPLYGIPLPDEYNCSFIEGADFDAEKSIYASLVQHKKGDDVNLFMAWTHLE